MKNRMMRFGLGLASMMLLAGCGGTSSAASSTAENSVADDSVASSVVASTFDKTKKIKAYSRDTTSGTRDGFMGKIGISGGATDDSKLRSDIVIVSSNGDMITSIKNDTYGIGYISLATLEESGLKGLNYENVVPSEENVMNGTYGLTRNFNYVYRNDAPETPAAQIIQAFVAFMGTQEGKTIIKEHDGIIDIKASDPKWNDIKSNYAIASSDNSAVTVRFGGSTSVEKIAKALTSAFSPLCGNFIANHNHTGSGDAYKHTQGASKDDQGALDMGFLSRELKLTGEEAAAEGTYGKICTDAIVAVVNNDNPYSSTTADVLKSIFDRETALATWDKVIL